MQGKDNIIYMQRCLDLAGRAMGMTYPNPLVGCVIVNNGLIIGEGYHLKAGSDHAEVIAINSVADKKLLKDSTLYVNLEPCSHFGKTPPCADMIISNGIRKVVIGSSDTSEKVSGEGIARLRDAGCKVTAGVLEEECRWINRRFFTFNEEKRPYIILKWAQSADGFIDYRRDKGFENKPVWITGEAERSLVHKWRAEEQAILAGAGTIRADNPKLNIRSWAGEDPLRVILSSSGDIDKRSALFEQNGTNIVLTHNTDAEFENSVIVKLNADLRSEPQILDYLFKKGIQSLIIEGGADVLRQFISAGLWDEARIFHGNDYFREGIKAPDIEGITVTSTGFGRSTLDLVLNSTGRFVYRIDNYNKNF
jgi:diaminohydroxyphosphoribosylaminopyrimidine deaminase/5-amino-6-(5-phosphoribosylamino)uracil reductase